MIVSNINFYVLQVTNKTISGFIRYDINMQVLCSVSHCLVEGNLDVAPVQSLPVHHRHRPLRVSLTSKPDDPDSPVLHLGVLDVPDVVEPVLQHLPGAVHGKVPHQDGVAPPGGPAPAPAPDAG